MHVADERVDWLAGQKRTSDASCQRTNTSFGHMLMDSNSARAHKTSQANVLFQCIDDTDDGFRFVLHSV